jgi:positive regulator of sigma E activity
MTQYTGIVVEIMGSDALVRTAGDGTACQLCPNRAACSPLAGGKEVIIRMPNHLDARPGDRVTIGDQAMGAGLRGLLITAAVVVFFLAGGSIGRWLADRLESDHLGGHLPLLSALAAAVAAGFYLHRRFHRQAGTLKMLEVQRQTVTEAGSSD